MGVACAAIRTCWQAPIPCLALVGGLLEIRGSLKVTLILRVSGDSTSAACALLLNECMDEGLCPLPSAHVSRLNFMKPRRGLPCSASATSSHKAGL